MLKKFNPGDIFTSVIRAYPKVEFFVNSGSVDSVYYNRVNENRTDRKDGHVHLNDIVGGFFEGQVFNFSYSSQQATVGTSASIAPNNSLGWENFAFESTPPPGLGIVPSTGLITGTFSVESLLTGTAPNIGVDTLVVSAFNPELGSLTSSFQLTVVGTDLSLPEHYLAFDDNNFLDNGDFIVVGNTFLRGSTVGSIVTGAASPIGEQTDHPGTAGNYLSIPVTEPISRPSDEFTHAITVTPADTSFRHAVHNGLSDGSPTFRGHYMGLRSSTQWTAYLGDGADKELSPVDNPTPVVAERRHLMSSFTANDFRIYIDGVERLDRTDVASVQYDPSSGIEFGLHPQFNSRFWSGNLDEWAWWDSNLDEFQKATIAWLSLTDTSLANWIRGSSLTAPVYDDTSPLPIGSAITPITPSTPATHDTVTPTYLEYDLLPDGLSIAPDGTISGTPTAAALLENEGIYSVRVAVSDGMNLVVSDPITIELEGVAVPVPEHHLAFDNVNFNTSTTFITTGATPLRGSIVGTVTTGVSSSIGEQTSHPGTSGNYLLIPSTQPVSLPSAEMTHALTVTPVDTTFRHAVSYHLSDGSPIRRGHYMGLRNASQWTAYLGDGGDNALNSTTAPVLAERRHLMSSFTANDFRIYIDGVEESDRTDVASLSYDPNSGIRFGYHPQFNSRYWRGNLDEWSWWDANLTDNQKATVAWLSLTDRSIAGWIRGSSLTAPAYASTSVSSGSPITPITPSTAATHDTVTPTYLEYDALPAGLSVDSAGTISGTPTTPGVYPVRVAATDDLNLVVSSTFTITVT